MATAGNGLAEHTEFRQAVRVGNYPAALSIARRLPRLDLLEALDLTLLAAREDQESYDRMAVRWVERLMAEREVSVTDVRRASEQLQSLVGIGDRRVAGAVLEEIVRERRRR